MTTASSADVVLSLGATSPRSQWSRKSGMPGDGVGIPNSMRYTLHCEESKIRGADAQIPSVSKLALLATIDLHHAGTSSP